MDNNQLVNLLRQLVAINSSFPNEFEIGQFIFNFLKRAGIKIQKQEVDKRRFNLLIEKGAGSKSILLLGHLDTIGVIKGWITNPFKLKVTGDRACGLGTWDMKGGLCVSILTFLNFKLKNFKLKLALVVDEENISRGGYKLVRSDFVKDVACILSSEPAFKYGLTGIVTGRISRAVYDVEITNPTKHFTFYEKKYDINIFVAKLLLQVQKLNKNIDQDRKQFIFARKIRSEAIGMSVPQKTIIQLDSSILPPKTHFRMLNEIKNISLKLNKKYSNYFNIKVGFIQRDTPFLESYQIKYNNRYVKILSRSIYEILHQKATPYFRSSVADENIFGAAGCTVLGIGPEGGNAHAANEWVSLSSLEKLYIILNNFLKKVEKNI